MGYMGFGMKKEVYSRKRRKAYKHYKKLYGERLDKFKLRKQQKGQNSKLTEADMEAFRAELRQKAKAENRKRLLVLIVSAVLTVVFLAGPETVSPN